MAQFGGQYGEGTLYRLSLQGRIQRLLSFSKLQMGVRHPASGLMEARDGNLYGCVGNGNAGEDGVYRVQPDGTFSMIRLFDASADEPRYPWGPLIQGLDGALYGVSFYGGLSDEGTVFRLGLSGDLTILASFSSADRSGYRPRAGLVQAADGTLYGLTRYGGLADGGTFFRLPAGGNPETLHAFTGGPADGMYPSDSLVRADDGLFYGATGAGGANDRGSVFRINVAGAA